MRSTGWQVVPSNAGLREAMVATAALVAAGCEPVPGRDGRPAIQVSDAFTAVVAHPISAPTFPFLGTDGKYHISYDLQLTNGSRLLATIDKIDVVDATAPTR